MGIIFDRLLPASFKGIPFSYISGTKTGGRKTITHEYPNKDFRFIEDLGLNLRTFSINALVKGILYDVEKLALENALNDPGIGILTHPYDGIIEVVCTGFTVTESLSKTGVAEYTMNFSESSKSIFPNSALNNISAIADLFASIYSLVGDDFNDNYSVNTNKNITTSGDKLKSVSSTLVTTANSVASINESDTNFTTEALKFNNSAFKIAGPLGDTGNDTSQLILDFDSLSTDGQTRFEASSKLIGFGSDDQYLNLDTKELNERTKDQRLINGLVNGLALINMCDGAKDINYQTEGDLNEAANKIDDVFDTIVSSDTNLFTSSFIDQIEEMRNQIRIFFDQTRLVINKIIEIETNPLPLTVIAYSYYEDTDEYNELIDLNAITNPSIVSGTIKILES